MEKVGQEEALSKERFAEISERYATISITNSFLNSPTMGMKDEVGKLVQVVGIDRREALRFIQRAVAAEYYPNLLKN